MSQPAPQPSWKQEVNRRLEAHKSRKGIALAPRPQPVEEHGSVSDRAARAAARVAARYAHAPSYSELQASEARAALRAAEAATRAALEAQAAAQAALANLAATNEEFEPVPDHIQKQWSEISEEPREYQSYSQTAPVDGVEDHIQPLTSVEIRWEPDLPQRPMTAPPAPGSQATGTDSFSAEGPAGVRITELSFLPQAAVETVEAAQPIAANVIHFPREIVATRRMRPRLATCAHDLGEDQYGQLSIFEVDPSTISTEPAATVTDSTAPSQPWAGAEWSGIKLDAEPEPEHPAQAAPDPAVRASQVHLAPIELRLMAAAVDFALTLCLAAAGVWGLAGHLHHAIPLKTAETGGLLAFIVIAAAYQASFLLSTLTTPGMMYAGIALCTFDDEYPTRAQLRGRLGALLVSLLPVGLGMAWAFFDEDRLSWHDRLSGTYPRKC